MFLGAKLRNLKWFEARALTQLSQTCCAPFCVCYLEKGELSFLDLTSSIPLEVLLRPLLLLIVTTLYWRQIEMHLFETQRSNVFVRKQNVRNKHVNKPP